MTQNFEAGDAMGRELLNAGLKNLSSPSAGAQSLILEAVDYSARSMEDGGGVAGKLAAAESASAAVEAQTVYARQAYEGLVAQATRMNALWADLTKNTLKPFESVVARANVDAGALGQICPKDHPAAC